MKISDKNPIDNNTVLMSDIRHVQKIIIIDFEII